ncbi:MAG: hypothetical protein WC412_05095, partial [Candidatus Omnitrophota bacterium]
MSNIVCKNTNGTVQILSSIQDKYPKVGLKIFDFKGAYPKGFNPDNDVDRALSLLKLSGNTVFITESYGKGEGLAAQVFFRLSGDIPGLKCIQLDLGALLAADKGQAG